MRYSVLAIIEVYPNSVRYFAKLQNVIGNFMKKTLENLNVTDRKSFIEFLELLRNDLINNPENWENKTLPDFLEALGSYAEDIQGYYDNMNINKNADQLEWSVISDMFKGAKIYE